MSDLDLRDEPYDGPAAQALIGAVQAEYVIRYGGPDKTPVDPAEFAPPDGMFLIGYLAGEPVAMGGLRRLDGAGSVVELKRMYVAPEHRGRGLARLVLAELEGRAGALGASRVVLETGDRQPEAISLYLSSGYSPTDNYGYYRCEPGAHSFEKLLRRPEAG